jgi:hypothetical protein
VVYFTDFNRDEIGMEDLGVYPVEFMAIEISSQSVF